MTDLELLLENCLEQLISGTFTLEEILAKHPQQAAQLKPLLRTAGHLKQVRENKPSPVIKARTRARLKNYLKVYPRPQPPMISPSFRVAVSMAVLVIAFMIAGTAFAQSELPGQPFYNWKLSSERLWRALTPDPEAADLILADRRISELKSVASDPAEKALALNGYLEVLARLQSESKSQNSTLILRSLTSQQSELSRSGISIPQLDHLILPTPSSLPANPPSAGPKPAATLIPKIIPTVGIPPLVP